MTVWYYSDAQRNRLGPVAAADLAALHANGQLAPDALVWRDGLAGWRPFHEVANEVLGLPDVGALPATAAVGGVNPYELVERPASSPYAPPTAGVVRPRLAVAGGPVVHARFLKRFASNAVDGVLTALLSYVLLIPMVLALGAGAGTLFDGAAAAGLGIGFIVAMYAVQIGIPAVYYGWMQASDAQATLGKRVAGIKIVRTDGSPIGFWRGFLRSVAYLFSILLTCGLGAIATLVMVLATERRQALHDLICDTIVVDRHAFTDRADLQDEALNTGSKVVLGLWLLLVVGVFVIAVLAGILSGASG
ncbi:RDD family protein [Lysobacter humi (ex Lee et al. 2017)]